MPNAIEDLIQKHLPSLKAQGMQLILLLEQNPTDYNATHALAHKLKGSSASLGFRELSKLCAEIESQSKEAQSGTRQALDHNLNETLKESAGTLSMKDSLLPKGHL